MSFIEMLKCCLNPKVILGALVAIVFVYVFAPQLAQYSWILLVLICPLSMLFMMAMMHKKSGKDEKDTEKDTKI